jgi:hypothetical protein
MTYIDRTWLSFTEREDEIIRQMFKRGKKDPYIAVELCRSPGSIQMRRTRKLGLKHNKYTKWTPERTEELRRLASDPNLTWKQIGEKFNLQEASMKSAGRTLGIRRPPKPSAIKDEHAPIILSMLAAEHFICEICQKIGVKKNVVIGWMKRNRHLLPENRVPPAGRGKKRVGVGVASRRTRDRWASGNAGRTSYANTGRSA